MLFRSKLDMISYSWQSRFGSCRQNQVQPSPPVHLCYLVEYVLPRLPIAIDSLRLQKLQTLVNTQHWIPYDPERQQKWIELKQQL